MSNVNADDQFAARAQALKGANLWPRTAEEEDVWNACRRHNNASIPKIGWDRVLSACVVALKTHRKSLEWTDAEARVHDEASRYMKNEGVEDIEPEDNNPEVHDDLEFAGEYIRHVRLYCGSRPACHRPQPLPRGGRVPGAPRVAKATTGWFGLMPEALAQAAAPGTGNASASNSAGPNGLIIIASRPRSAIIQPAALQEANEDAAGAIDADNPDHTPATGSGMRSKKRKAFIDLTESDEEPVASSRKGPARKAKKMKA